MSVWKRQPSLADEQNRSFITDMWEDELYAFQKEAVEKFWGGMKWSLHFLMMKMIFFLVHLQDCREILRIWHFVVTKMTCLPSSKKSPKMFLNIKITGDEWWRFRDSPMRNEWVTYLLRPEAIGNPSVLLEGTSWIRTVGSMMRIHVIIGGCRGCWTNGWCDFLTHCATTAAVVAVEQRVDRSHRRSFVTWIPKD